MIREEAFAIYTAKSKTGAAACNTAHAAASQAYDREMQPIYEARRRGEINNAALTAGMRKADRRRDIACQRADAEYALLMKQAHEEYICALQTMQAPAISVFNDKEKSMPTLKAPAMISQRIYDEIIRDAQRIAMHQHGTSELKDALFSDFSHELSELTPNIDRIDAYLEAADILYNLCGHWYITGKAPFRAALMMLEEIFPASFNEDFDLDKALDGMRTIYAR